MSVGCQKIVLSHLVMIGVMMVDGSLPKRVCSNWNLEMATRVTTLHPISLSPYSPLEDRRIPLQFKLIPGWYRALTGLVLV